MPGLDHDRRSLGADLTLLVRSVVVGVAELARGRVHQPSGRVGSRVRFADGTAGVVYRETARDRAVIDAPTVLVVRFRLRRIRSARWHAAFRWESLANTVLFVGFPGFVSKLWCAHDERGRYRGVYQWDGVDRAEAYVSALRRVLALVSERSSIDHVTLPGLDRDAVLAEPSTTEAIRPDGRDAWWRPIVTVRALSSAEPRRDAPRSGSRHARRSARTRRGRGSPPGADCRTRRH